MLKTPSGADPLVRAVPQDPLFGAPYLYQQADEGVGCGPWGPPHLASSTESVILILHNAQEAIYSTSLD